LFFPQTNRKANVLTLADTDVDPFPDDPDLGRLVLTSEQLSHQRYQAMCTQLRDSAGIRHCIRIDPLEELTWPNKPCRITIINPRPVLVVYRMLQIGLNEPVHISSFDYYAPDCDADELRSWVQYFFTNCSLPPQLREIRDQYGDCYNEDPYKICEILFTAGLDERYIAKNLQPIP
jgi:hypothetical protein